ncbi:hypothetical protein QFX18_02565 [Saccharophagus degradans]|uniref:hypothetical protein n=1 Tax=Saccharophagus degradans TaxID=86304 RepID=UPI002477E1BD|nr:hypothetical protein [Saccharophagus degradans]WGO98943.1 hypothetical protein QFX18_02565 [Saccharophagus degradans]
MKISIVFCLAVLISSDISACVDFSRQFKSISIGDAMKSWSEPAVSSVWNVSEVNGRVCVEMAGGSQSNVPQGLNELVFWFRLEQIAYWHRTERGWIVTEQASGYPSRTWWLASDGSSMQYIGAYKLYAYKIINGSVYALPRLPGNADVNGVVRLTESSSGRWEAKRVAQFIEFPMREIKSNDNGIYFLAGNAIYVYTPDNGLELFKKIESMPKTLPSSAVKIGDVFWFGGADSVFSLNPKTNAYNYYAISNQGG